MASLIRPHVFLVVIVTDLNGSVRVSSFQLEVEVLDTSRTFIRKLSRNPKYYCFHTGSHMQTPGWTAFTAWISLGIGLCGHFRIKVRKCPNTRTLPNKGLEVSRTSTLWAGNSTSMHENQIQEAFFWFQKVFQTQKKLSNIFTMQISMVSENLPYPSTLVSEGLPIPY